MQRPGVAADQGRITLKGGIPSIDFIYSANHFVEVIYVQGSSINVSSKTTLQNATRHLHLYYVSHYAKQFIRQSSISETHMRSLVLFRDRGYCAFIYREGYHDIQGRPLIRNSIRQINPAGTRIR